jgi:hypothetical protein
MELIEQSQTGPIKHERITCGTLQVKPPSFTNRQNHASKPKDVTYMHDRATDGLQYSSQPELLGIIKHTATLLHV